MYVYALYNKRKVFKPFYIGITDNPKRRLEQHWYKKEHRQFVNHPTEIGMKILFDTGNCKDSRYQAEELEKQMICHYNTINHGSNRCVDIIDCLPVRYVDYSERYSGNLKEKDVIRLKKLQDILTENPFVSGEEVASFLFISKSGLDKFLKRKLNVTLMDIMNMYRRKYFEDYSTGISQDETKTVS